MKAITGQNPVEQVVYPHKGVTLAQADVSITEPGVPPDQGTAASGRPLMPTRRSLDQRRGEMVDHSAMTPAGFVEQVRMMQQAGGSSAGTDQDMVELMRSRLSSWMLWRERKAAPHRSLDRSAPQRHSDLFVRNHKA